MCAVCLVRNYPQTLIGIIMVTLNVGLLLVFVGVGMRVGLLRVRAKLAAKGQKASDDVQHTRMPLAQRMAQLWRRGGVVKRARATSSNHEGMPAGKVPVEEEQVAIEVVTGTCPACTPQERASK